MITQLVQKWIGVQIYDSLPRSIWSYTAAFGVVKSSYVISKLHMAEPRCACSLRKTFRRSTKFFTNVITLCGTSLILEGVAGPKIRLKCCFCESLNRKHTAYFEVHEHSSSLDNYPQEYITPRVCNCSPWSP